MYYKYICNNKIIKYSIVHETYYAIANKSCHLPKFYFFIFPLFFPYLIQDFMINATKQLEAELATKPSCEDINFSCNF